MPTDIGVRWAEPCRKWGHVRKQAANKQWSWPIADQILEFRADTGEKWFLALKIGGSKAPQSEHWRESPIPSVIRFAVEIPAPQQSERARR